MPACCVVPLSLSAGPCYLHLSLLYLSPFLIPPLRAVILSPSLTVCLMFGPSAGFVVLCLWYRGIVFRCYLRILHAIFSVAAASCEGYLAAVSGFYLCIIFRVISALLSPCYLMPRSRWWPFSPDSILKCSQECLSGSLPRIIMGIFYFPLFVDVIIFDFLSLFYFSSCVYIAFSWMCTFSYESNMFSSKGCLCFCHATAIRLLPSFAYACVYTAASLCCSIWFGAWRDS